MSSIRDTEVQEWMSKGVRTLLDSQTVGDALTLMTQERVAALPIISSSGACVGIVSTSDLLKVAESMGKLLESDLPRLDDCLWAVDFIQQRMGGNPIRSVMTDLVATIRPDTTMHDAACLMINNRVHHLPVVATSGRLVGLLSSYDFVRFVSQIRVSRGT